jgi:hypothetical protein
VIRTQTSLTHGAQSPHCKFFTLAGLELQRAVCTMVRDAARKRLREMENKLTEIGHQQARLFRAVGGARQSRPPAASGRRAAESGELPPARFVLKY